MASKNDNGMSRRRFLKFTAAGALAFGSVPTIIIPKRAEAYQAGGRLQPPQTGGPRDATFPRRRQMIWGVACGGWMSGLMAGAPDRFKAEMEFVAEHGLHALEWGAGALMRLEPGRREDIARMLEDLDIYTALGVGFDYLSEDADAVKRGTETVQQQMETLPKMMRTRVCVTDLRRYHRFMRKPSLAEQLDGFSERMAPVADAAWRAGCPVGIHNTSHYGADLAELCRRTPHLGVFFDTGNPFLVGEPPVLAAQAVAPYVVGTHFKDHYVQPVFKPLSFGITGAVLGEGDAGLREIYDIVLKDTPEADKLLMIMEIDPVEGLTPLQGLAKSMEFVRNLPVPASRR